MKKSCKISEQEISAKNYPFNAVYRVKPWYVQNLQIKEYDIKHHGKTTGLHKDNLEKKAIIMLHVPFRNFLHIFLQLIFVFFLLGKCDQMRNVLQFTWE